MKGRWHIISSTVIAVSIILSGTCIASSNKSDSEKCKVLKKKHIKEIERIKKTPSPIGVTDKLKQQSLEKEKYNYKGLREMNNCRG